MINQRACTIMVLNMEFIMHLGLIEHLLAVSVDMLQPSGLTGIKACRYFLGEKDRPEMLGSIVPW